MGEMADWAYDQALNEMAEESDVVFHFDRIILDRNDLKAILFQIEDREVWIPRSLIEQLDEGSNEINVPEWFALKEGLI